MTAGDTQDAGQRAPMTPAQAAHNRKIILVIAIVFVLVSISVSVWGYLITRASRDRANETDSALRSVAWAVLCYASEYSGAFPTTDAQLDGGKLTTLPPAGKPWPSSQDSALGGLSVRSVVDARKSIGITWGATAEVAPSLNTKGNPSSIGTVEAVNGWFTEFAREQVRAGAVNAERKEVK